MIRLSATPLSARDIEAAVLSPSHGAVLTFVGTARNNRGDRVVVALEYEAYDAMALRELSVIAAEAEARWPGTLIAIAHRTGLVLIGDPAVVISVSTPHRDAAYAASRFLIDTLKSRVPIWKKERYADGGDWIDNRP